MYLIGHMSLLINSTLYVVTTFLSGTEILPLDLDLDVTLTRN